MMRFLQWIIKKAVERRMREVDAVLRDPAAAQERLLLSLVRRARETEWGRTHGYARIRTVRDYQRAVQVSRYADLAPLWHRAFDGARDVTWPGHIRYFALSSGTTAGATKALPVSREAIRANVRAGTTLLGIWARLAGAAALASGRTFYFGGSTRLEPRGQCLQGDASGINHANLPRFTRRFRLPDPDIAALTEWDARVRAICDRHLDAPVSAVVGLPSWTLILFRRLIDTARERRGSSVATVADLWPRLGTFIHFGMAFGPYRRQLAELVGKPILTIDTYSSSEGGLSAIQTDPADASMQLDLDTCAFFEFVPAEEIGRPEPTRLTIGEVETGRDYALLLSTPSGIWAYDVGDVVRFTSLRPPKIVIAGRTQLALNVFGEHVIQENLEQALVDACGTLGVRVAEFTVGSMLPTASEPRGRHVWLVEFEGAPPPIEAFAPAVDAAVAQRSLDYKTERTRDVSMLPPHVVALAPGTFFEWMRRHGALGGQHKVPRVARSQEMIDELGAISQTLSAGRVS